eukprot:TRINITY_DN25511_c1_g1_i1.p1 TRINITY_DN25511_c1_g1~~TRINITY_DN25511_c1_g1_i1.p1  ORF type:complete len:492 (-),score=78.96 TRINITY_DN25511_c1_g1_i1:9-1454(-)
MEPDMPHRNSYVTGGEGDRCWLRIRLPRLDKRARARLRSPKSGGCSIGSSERELLESYRSLVEKAEKEGFTLSDAFGPDSFQEKCLRIQKQIELEHADVAKRLMIAKRIASEQKDVAFSLKVLEPARAALEACMNAIESHRLVVNLWEESKARIKNTVDETEELKLYNQIETVEQPVAAGNPVPRYSLLEPLPTAMLPLRRPAAAAAASEDTNLFCWEKLYDDAQAACARGELSMANAFVFFRALESEKLIIQNESPSRQRVLKAKSFKHVCNLVHQSHIQVDLEDHRLFMVRHRCIFTVPGRGEVPGGREAMASVFPEMAHSLLRDHGSNKSESCSAQNGYRSQLQLVGGSSAAAEDTTSKQQTSGLQSVSSEHTCFQQFPALGFSNDEEDDLSGVCVSCLERPAKLVAKTCGHLVYCRPCQRQAIARQLEAQARASEAKRRAHTLNNKEMDRTRLPCPICRSEGVLIIRESYTGKIFEL